MARSRHPNKHIELALQQAESAGWRVRESKGQSSHCWGMIFCPRNDREGCKTAVYCTPKNPQNHARHLLSEVDACRCVEVKDSGNQE